METLVLIDTSSWIEALRSQGDPQVRTRVADLILQGRAAWCDLVVVELWNGAGGSYEKKKLAELEREIPCLPIDQQVWQMARQLAQQCRKAGKTVPVADLVIVACALVHQAPLDHQDSHFAAILEARASEK